MAQRLTERAHLREERSIIRESQRLAEHTKVGRAYGTLIETLLDSVVELTPFDFLTTEEVEEYERRNEANLANTTARCLPGTPK